MGLYSVSGTYGSQNTPCEVLVYPVNQGYWYCVAGSVNVNFTYDDIVDGVDVETLADVDCFTAGEAIDYPEELEVEVDDYLYS